LKSAPGQDHRRAVRDAAKQRRESEDPQPNGEHAAAPEEIAKPAAEQQQPAEGEGIDGHDPGQPGIGKAEVGLDVGQSDVADSAV
jgi:hypothetical protein